MGISPIVAGQVVKKVSPSPSSSGILFCLDGTNRTCWGQIATSSGTAITPLTLTVAAGSAVAGLLITLIGRYQALSGLLGRAEQKLGISAQGAVSPPTFLTSR
jgi:hypothetical protein